LSLGCQPLCPPRQVVEFKKGGLFYEAHYYVTQPDGKYMFMFWQRVPDGFWKFIGLRSLQDIEKMEKGNDTKGL
jgi:hypothetical protein